MCDKPQNLNKWKNSKNWNYEKNIKKTQIVTKIKNQILTKLQNSNCAKLQKIKLLLNSNCERSNSDSSDSSSSKSSKSDIF